MHLRAGSVELVLQWRDQLSIGNDLLDSDHKHLIDLINLADHSMKAKNRVDIVSILGKLFDYSNVHFSREENLAAFVGYTQVEHLHVSHDALLKELEQVTQEISAKWTPSTHEHFVAFLRNWLINHVIKEDMLLKPFLIKHSHLLTPK